ncbi:gamma-butyrobetaine hydroxylase-like domain-containing protein [Halopseudomonas aestusnigri]|uniref:DUF971 family protein n=1 Tax=Halopseudomonas aestusnigri TaxID=857252 RepID=A0AAQ1G932_9GAMM|nr:DUF971 domain-containing protein [Halopseudomonas aestusnigri]OWL88131.1 1-(5-phosphoribosyl)-5-((5-phosphoribosylamino)methylideneamino)imidazole-4-carboxamide isomerase [Halopseudomonas aestusnigri]SEG47120.1 DUF971 family protein [Halopseudomonas aestusnigri]
MPAPIPTRIKLHKASRTLELGYTDGRSYQLPAEYLRVLSPSAEVRGHGRPVLQAGKINVALVGVEPAGRYALKLVFDDGHDSGLYSWDYLYRLATEQAQRWQAYLDELHQAGASRDPDVSAIRFIP